jgi:membrane protein DedA with SNARE-associated domain
MMVDWITSTIKSMGYPGVALLMLIENVFPPIPSEVVMPFAGMVATRGDMSFLGVIVAGTAGSVAGAVLLYWIGHTVDEAKLEQWADRHGRWLTVSGEEIRKARDGFERHGGMVVLFGRVIPAVRSLISIPAGTARMHLGVFLFYTTLGSAAWAALLAALGYLLGRNYERVETYLSPVTWAIIGAIVVTYVVRIVRHDGGSPASRKAEVRSP